MREILFRGKRIDNGEWIEGIPIKTHIGTFIVFEDNPHYCGQYGYMEIDKLAKVIPETIGQYTGLTDKNGVRVFEADILRSENDDGEFSLYSCEWAGEICGWIIRFLEYDVPCDAFDARFCMDAQVIGNIHDNPELLEVSGDV